MFTHHLPDEDTIVAPATAEGRSALAVIRISGPDAFVIASKLFRGPDPVKQNSHTLHYGHIVDGEEVIDEVMLAVFRSPKSFTAEHTVEISCHGSLYIQRRIMEAAVRHGARPANPGEFTMRAYLNGRIDLAQAEAVGDIIASDNSSQLEMAIRQLKGGLSDDLGKLRTSLVDFTSLLELELDFGEEDVEFANRDQLRSKVEEIIAAIDPVLSSFRYGNAIRNGIPVAIIGRPNAGKSSLLNALLNDERAIVSDIAGTTRDTIEEQIHIEGIAYRFIDTAGIRDTGDTIEKIGIEKALKKIDEARIVIYIYDLSTLEASGLQDDLAMIRRRNPEAGILVIGNKADLAGKVADHELALEHVRVLFLSVKEGGHTAMDEIRSELVALSQTDRPHGSTVISNARHHQCLLEAREALEEVLKLMEQGGSSDLLALELKRAIRAVGDITGLISGDEVLANIFGKFCIGK